MDLVELSNIFDLKYGNKFDANKMTFSESGDINFISRISKNNGCVGTVVKYNGIDPFQAGLITVSLGGSILSCFVQPTQFYTAQNVAVLIPKRSMSLNEKLYYCKCISINRFKYNAFGREANKTLKFLQIPEKTPDWVNENTSSSNSNSIIEPVSSRNVSLDDREFKDFIYSDLFDIKKGKRIVASKLSTRGDCPLVAAIDKNNGIRDMLDVKPNHDGNTITVNYNGSVGEAFYQENPYWATDDVNVLYPKFELNVFIAMFLITMIRKEKYRFSFGRKWHKERMKKSMIRLPVNAVGEPDWTFMEEYIKSLPYTKQLMPIRDVEGVQLSRQATQKTFYDY